MRRPVICTDHSSLYCWTVELFGFNEDSILKKEMEYRGIKSIMCARFTGFTA